MTLDRFKGELDKFLNGVPDKPTILGRARADRLSGWLIWLSGWLSWLSGWLNWLKGRFSFSFKYISEPYKWQ